MAYGILEGVKGFMEYEMISEKELDRLLEKEQGFVIDLHRGNMQLITFRER